MTDAPAGKVNPLSSLLEQALSPVAQDLKALQGCILDFLPLSTQSSKDIAAHIFSAGGKRIRPALYFFASNLVGYKGDHKMSMAAVCEFVHTASLLHDDVVDDSTLRRNRPTANSVWGSASAVLVGDLIYSRASELMAATGNVEVVESFARAIRLMSEGELLQLENVATLLMTKEDYYQVITNKTAALIAATCSAPAMLQGCSRDQIEALKTYGLNVGLSFQIVDDVLDYFADEIGFGKPKGSDLINGRVTLPIIYLLNVAREGDLATIKAIQDKPKKTQDDINTICKLVESYETAHRALETARDMSQKAIKALDCFEDSQAKRDLTEIAQALMLRTI